VFKVNIPITNKIKISLKTIDCAFVGYSFNSTSNWFLVLNSEFFETINNTIIESSDVFFFKNIFPMKNNVLNLLIKVILLKHTLFIIMLLVKLERVK